VPHQANIRIIESAARKLGVPMEKTVVNIERYGNTTAGTRFSGMSQVIPERAPL
jgi:3-oxoacyl-[acyl-carrier-protein] synthase-3